MKKDSKKNKLFLLLILVLTVSIGYAALATTLKINGNTTVKGLNWSIYWDNVQVTSGSVTGANVTTTPTTTGTTTTEIDFAVILPEPGDFYEFEVDAVNAGTIDAMIKDNGIITKAYSDANYTNEVTLPDVVKYTVTYADGTEIEDNHLLAKKNGNTPTRETYKVRVEYRNDEEINPSDLDSANDRVYYLKFQVEYVQADGNAIPSHSAIHYVTRQNEGQITPGDIIGIGETEDFYVISSDSTKTVLLAKYNLLVGQSWGEELTSETAGYGLQSINAYGYIKGDSKAATPFSSTNYWDDGTDENPNLISPYNSNGASYSGNPYPYVYDSNYVTAPDFSDECDYETNCYYTPGYSIAYYVEQYVTTLKGMGAPSTITGRLLSYEEANEAKILEDNNHSIILTGINAYWLGSANSSGIVIGVDGSSEFSSDGSGNDCWFGVRPVIEIPTSEIR